MLSLIKQNRSTLDDYDFLFVASSPTLYHGHHFNLFFDQTIDDALGVERSIDVRTQAAYEASSQLIESLISVLPDNTAEARLTAAQILFAALGQGTLEFDVTAEGGKVVGRSLHYGLGWKEKYGVQIKRAHPADAVATGYIMAAIEAAFELPMGSVECAETGCVAVAAADHCQFEVRHDEQDKTVSGVTKSNIEGAVPAPLTGMNEDDVARMARSLRRFIVDEDADERGLFEICGLMVTQHLSNYYNRCTSRMLDILGKEKTGVVEVAKELLRECGQQSGYYTFASILTSPEWDALVTSASNKPAAIIDGSLAIARALGFGRWSLESYEADKSLVLTSPSTYESIYGKIAYPPDQQSGCCFLFQGAALSMMQLAHRFPWAENPTLTSSLYQQIKKDSPWKVEETHCVAAGASMCRVVVQ